MNEKEYSCSINSAGVDLNFKSRVDLLNLFEDSSYTKWIPELVTSRDLSNSDYCVYYNDNKRKTIKYGENNVKINYPWNMMLNGETILYAGYPLIEQQRQAKQSATIHAGCVELNGQGILFLGESGSGKTTLATKLCYEIGAKLFSNDLAVVGLDENGFYCLGGTKFFNFRSESVARSLPFLSNLFPESRKDTWSQKIAVNAKDLNIVLGRGRTNINHVYKIHVDDSKNELVYRSIDNDLSNKLNLYENLTRYVRSSVTAITGGENYDLIGYIPSLDKPEFFYWRKKVIETIIDQEKSLYLSGPSNKMVDFITKQCA